MMSNSILRMANVMQLRSKMAGLLRSLSLIITLGLLTSGAASGQGTVPCPPNLDFEQGNYGNWTYEVGYSNTGPATDGVTFGSITPTYGTQGNGLGNPITIPTTNPNPAPWAAPVTPLSPRPLGRNPGQPLWSRFD